MTCLIDYIGIRGCSNETPESGLYIDSLPGISLESMDKIADSSQQITYKGVYKDAQVEASERFSIDFFEKLTECYQVKPYCDYDNLICINKKLLSSAWKYLLGNQLMLYRLYSSRLNYFTTVSLEQAAELRDYYQAQYELALSKAVKLIDTSDCCLECGGDPQVVTWLP